MESTARPASTITPPRRSATVHYTDTNDWKSGFVGEIMITNTGSATIDSWTLQFEFAVQDHLGLGATIVRHTGTRYVVRDLEK